MDRKEKTVERLRKKIEQRKAQQLFDEEFGTKDETPEQLNEKVNNVLKHIKDDMDEEAIINLFQAGKVDPWKLTQDQQDKIYKSLPKEQQAAIDRYRKMFEKFYTEDLSNPKPYVENEENLIDIMAQLKSGLEISELSNDDKIFLAEYYGFDWENIIYKKLYGTSE